MATDIRLHRPGEPGARVAYSGFSWTTCFFGFFPARFRRDWVGFLLGVGVWIVTRGTRKALSPGSPG